MNFELVLVAGCILVGLAMAVGFEHLGTEQHLGDVPANSEDCKSATTPVDPQDKHVNAHRPQPHKHGHVGGNTPTGRTPDYAPQPLPPPRLTGEGAVRIPRARRRRVERARRLAERARRRLAVPVIAPRAGESSNTKGVRCEPSSSCTFQYHAP